MPNEIKVTHELDYMSWGCPHCNFRTKDFELQAYGRTSTGSSIETCGFCDNQFVMINGNTNESILPIREDGQPNKVQNHPYYGKPFELFNR